MEPGREMSGRRATKAPEPSWEQETRRVASRWGTTAAASLALSKAQSRCIARVEGAFGVHVFFGSDFHAGASVGPPILARAALPRSA